MTPCNRLQPGATPINNIRSDNIKQAAPMLLKEDDQIPDVDFKKIEPAINNMVKDSQQKRSERMKKLPANIATQINAFEKNLLNSLQPQFFKLAEFYQLVDEDNVGDDRLNGLLESDEDLEVQDENLEVQIEKFNNNVDEIETQINNTTNEIKRLIQNILFEFSDLRMTTTWFSDWWKLNKIKEAHDRLTHINFMHEQILNHCIDQASFLIDTQHIIQTDKSEIIRCFYSDPLVINPDSVTFNLFPVQSETHNRGKLPLKVTFSFEKRELFSIFFKPRDAQIDQTVINVFHELNNLPQEKKSIKTDLPTYKIECVNSESYSFSIWEYIEGTHSSAGDASDYINRYFSTNDHLKDQLTRLQIVCKYLEISDLHMENIIFSHMGKPNLQVVPIDLESVQPNSDTGLGNPLKKAPTLTESEKELLDDCKIKMKKHTTRFVPIPTSTFTGSLSECSSCVLCAQLVKDKIRKEGSHLLISIERLEWMILEDFIHDDIPYLTLKSECIYYKNEKLAEFNKGRLL